MGQEGLPLLTVLSPSGGIRGGCGWGQGRKDGGREGGVWTEPALFRREHRALAPVESRDCGRETLKQELGRKGWGNSTQRERKEGQRKAETRERQRQTWKETERRKIRSRETDTYREHQR